MASQRTAIQRDGLHVAPRLAVAAQPLAALIEGRIEPVLEVVGVIGRDDPVELVGSAVAYHLLAIDEEAGRQDQDEFLPRIGRAEFLLKLAMAARFDDRCPLGDGRFRQRQHRLGYRDGFHLQSGSSHLHYLGFGADCAVNHRVMAELLNIQRLSAGPFSRCP